MLGLYDLMDEAGMADFPAELIGELNNVRLKFMDEFEARIPGHGKGHSVWRRLPFDLSKRTLGEKGFLQYTLVIPMSVASATDQLRWHACPLQKRRELVLDDLGRNLTYGLQNALGRAIVGGEYADRPFPSEADLTREHGVSRSVTREAVKMLTAKGLLGARPKQGTFVLPAESWSLFDPDVLRWLLDRKLSYELLVHFNELRVAVEPQASALAALRAAPDQLASIDAGLERMAAAEKGEDDTLEADIAFHVAILRASNNPFFVQFRDLVSTALRTSIRFTNRLAGQSGNVKEHAAVRDAIRAQNPQQAHAAMAALIGNVLVLINQQRAS